MRVPGVTRRMTSRRTTDLPPRFRASAGSSTCSQTATRVTERDQLLQVLVGGVDGHAAHRNVGALVLAALGERDAERARGDLGVTKEHLVEVAHPVDSRQSGLAALISMYCAIMGVDGSAIGDVDGAAGAALSSSSGISARVSMADKASRCPGGYRTPAAGFPPPAAAPRRLYRQAAVIRSGRRAEPRRSPGDHQKTWPRASSRRRPARPSPTRKR